MKQTTGPKLPVKDHGRTAHHKPNTVLKLQKEDHKPTRKRDHTPPISDPLSVEKTELRSEGLKTMYKEQIGGQQYFKMENKKNVEVHSKVNHINIDRSNVRPNPRHVNASPRIEKKNDFSYYTLENVPKTQNDAEFKKFLHTKGIDPVSVKIYQDTITHKNNGKAFMVLNSDNNKVEEIKTKLQANGITLNSESKLKQVYHH